jgi:hypothetical protein
MKAACATRLVELLRAAGDMLRFELTRRSVFCLRIRLIRISAASPIHNSKCSSASSRSD